MGPIGLLCIRRTLNDGRLAGLVSGLGAASADAVYGSFAALGVSALTTLLIDGAHILQIGGALFLIVLGINSFLADTPTEAAATSSSRGLAGAYLSTFLLTLTNPVTILAFIGIFSGLGADRLNGEIFNAGLMVAGVFLGSALWWSLLTGGVSLMRRRIGPGLMRWINRLSGLLLIAFALAILLNKG